MRAVLFPRLLETPTRRGHGGGGKVTATLKSRDSSGLMIEFEQGAGGERPSRIGSLNDDRATR